MWILRIKVHRFKCNYLTLSVCQVQMHRITINRKCCTCECHEIGVHQPGKIPAQLQGLLHQQGLHPGNLNWDGSWVAWVKRKRKMDRETCLPHSVSQFCPEPCCQVHTMSSGKVRICTQDFLCQSWQLLTPESTNSELHIIAIEIKS